MNHHWIIKIVILSRLLTDSSPKHQGNNLLFLCMFRLRCAMTSSMYIQDKHNFILYLLPCKAGNRIINKPSKESIPAMRTRLRLKTAEISNESSLNHNDNYLLLLRMYWEGSLIHENSHILIYLCCSRLLTESSLNNHYLPLCLYRSRLAIGSSLHKLLILLFLSSYKLLIESSLKRRMNRHCTI